MNRVVCAVALLCLLIPASLTLPADLNNSEISEAGSANCDTSINVIKYGPEDILVIPENNKPDILAETTRQSRTILNSQIFSFIGRNGPYICGSIECPEDTETCQYSLILPDYYRIPETRQRCLSKDGTILFETYEPARP